MSLVEIPLNSAWRSIAAEYFSYSSACCFCSAAVGGGVSFVSGCGMASIFLGGCSCSSGTSLRNSPSAVNSRRSVTVKVSFFFSGISRVDRTLLSDQNLRRSLGRQHRNSKLRLSSYVLFSSDHQLAAAVSQRDCAVAFISRQCCRACQLRDVFTFMLNAETRRRNCTFDLESRKHPMHRAPRADTLNNFLSDVAALIEIQRAVLTGLLRQVLLSDVHAEFGNAAGDTQNLERFRMNLQCARLYQNIPNLLRGIAPYGDFVTGN